MMADYALRWCESCGISTWHTYTDYEGWQCRAEKM